MPPRAGPRSLSLGISPLSAYFLRRTHPFLPLSVSKRPCQPLNIVKSFSGLRLQPVNISLSLCENLLTNQLLTGVNKMPTPLTLRGCTLHPSTYLRRITDYQNFCTFADDKERSFFSPRTRAAYILRIINIFFYYGKN